MMQRQKVRGQTYTLGLNSTGANVPIAPMESVPMIRIHFVPFLQ